jgi:Lon protease-like protein
MSILIAPLFPLDGVILFPNSSLPLNIFEKKYIEMINYSLASNRMVGMIQSKDKNNLYNFGCVGKIISFDETSDGRYLITLLGKNYFSISEEISTKKKFKLAKIKITEVQKHQSTKAFKRELLLKNYREYVNKLKIKIDIELVSQVENIQLIKFIAMSCPFSSADKQMLLETVDLTKLEDKLISLLGFYSKNMDEKNSIN